MMEPRLEDYLDQYNYATSSYVTTREAYEWYSEDLADYNKYLKDKLRRLQREETIQSLDNILEEIQ